MSWLLGPDMGSRYVYLPNGQPAVGRVATFYSDALGTLLADIRHYDGTATVGAAIGSQLTIDDNGLIPQFWFPEDVDRLFVSVNGGVISPVDADNNSRMDAFESMVLRDLFGYIDNAIESAPRSPDAGYQMGTGRVELSYVRAYRTVAVTQLGVATRSIAAVGVTAIRRGIYSVATNGDLTLVARTATITSSYGTQWTEYIDPLNSTGGFPTSYTLVKGQAYAFGHFMTFTTTAPQLRGHLVNTPTTLTARAPRVAGSMSGQVDLPTSIANGSVGGAGNAIYQYALA